MTDPERARPLPFDGVARWVWAGDSAAPRGDDYRMACFRRCFQVPPGRHALLLHVSADSRYILWVNGVRVARGPAKGDIEHQFYDTVDAAPYLVEGRNVLAALVVSYAPSWPFVQATGAPASIMSATSAFVLDADLRNPGAETRGVDLSTGTSGWRARSDVAHRHAHREGTISFTGMYEDFDARRYPEGWQGVDFDDSGWPPVHVLEPAVRPDTVRDCNLPYRLVPRMIPALEERDRRFVAAWNHRGVDEKSVRALLASDAPLTLPAGAAASFVVDAGEMTTAFPFLHLLGGRDSLIRLTYAEAWTVDGRTSPFHDPGRGTIVGCWDTCTCADGLQAWEPLHWRAFRYVRIDITGGDSPLTIKRLAFRFIGYPFKETASFSSSDSRHARIWDISWRTLRLCSHETYEDCPYYEQLQYSADVHAAMLYTGLISGDWRLARQAVIQFDWSRGPEGLTRSRYPSRVPQFIPSWSLLWVLMAVDYWWHTADLATARSCLDGISDCLRWFARFENDDGLLQALPYWKIVDWVKEWRDPLGYPPGAEGGVSAVINLQYAAALRAAARLEEAAGNADLAEKLRSRAARVGASINRLCWREAEGLYADRPGGEELSELCQAWAILCGAAGGERASRICDHLGRDGRLARATFYGRFYVFRAMSAAGRYDRAEPLFGWWTDLLATDLTTWPEEPLLGRSFCHAWSCAPVYEFLTEILGVRPAAPGFSRVEIAPQPLSLSNARGVVPTSHGPVEVSWRREAGHLEVQAGLPDRVTGSLRLPGGIVRELPPGRSVNAAPYPAAEP